MKTSVLGVLTCTGAGAGAKDCVEPPVAEVCCWWEEDLGASIFSSFTPLVD